MHHRASACWTTVAWGLLLIYNISKSLAWATTKALNLVWNFVFSLGSFTPVHSHIFIRSSFVSFCLSSYTSLTISLGAPSLSLGFNYTIWFPSYKVFKQAKVTSYCLGVCVCIFKRPGNNKYKIQSSYLEGRKESKQRDIIEEGDIGKNKLSVIML